VVRRGFTGTSKLPSAPPFTRAALAQRRSVAGRCSSPAEETARVRPVSFVRSPYTSGVALSGGERPSTPTVNQVERRRSARRTAGPVIVDSPRAPIAVTDATRREEFVVVCTSSRRPGARSTLPSLAAE
jgi:hypothetical protein